jgi:hypothetical protein
MIAGAVTYDCALFLHHFQQLIWQVYRAQPLGVLSIKGSCAIEPTLRTPNPFPNVKMASFEGNETELPAAMMCFVTKGF